MEFGAREYMARLCLGHLTEVTESVLPTFSAGEVRCDPPNNKLDKFSGTLSYLGNTYLLNHERLLLRGCVIRNTDWCYGLVVYTGTLPPRHSQTQPVSVSACSPPSCG